MKKLRVTVDGKVYEVLVEMLDEPAALAARPPAAPAPVPPVAPVAPVAPPAAAPVPTATATPATVDASSVCSPMAGKVVSIDVRVGDTVAEGAQLVTLEAMKMNTYVFAPRAGKITAVHAAGGEAVEEGAPLLSLA